MMQNSEGRRPRAGARRSPYGMVFGIVLGLAIGLAVGVATDDIGVWIGRGAALGVVLGAAFTVRPRRSDDHEPVH